jgi:hypothetical protein
MTTPCQNTFENAGVFLDDLVRNVIVMLTEIDSAGHVGTKTTASKNNPCRNIFLDFEDT